MCIFYLALILKLNTYGAHLFNQSESNALVLVDKIGANVDAHFLSGKVVHNVLVERGVSNSGVAES